MINGVDDPRITKDQAEEYRKMQAQVLIDLYEWTKRARRILKNGDELVDEMLSLPKVGEILRYFEKIDEERSQGK